MATLRQRQAVGLKLVEALENSKELPAHAVVAIQELREKLGRNELSNAVIDVLQNQQIVTHDFDASGRWTRLDSVDGYFPRLKKQRVKEDPAFDALKAGLEDAYEADGLAGALRHLRAVILQLDDLHWQSAIPISTKQISGDDFKSIEETIGKLSKSQKKRATDHRLTESRISGTIELDSLINTTTSEKSRKEARLAKTKSTRPPMDGVLAEITLAKMRHKKKVAGTR